MKPGTYIGDAVRGRAEFVTVFYKKHKRASAGFMVHWHTHDSAYEEEPNGFIEAFNPTPDSPLARLLYNPAGKEKVL